MKRILLGLALFFSLIQSSFAVEVPEGRVIDLITVGGGSALAVAGTDTAYSNSFPMDNATAYNLAVQSSAASNFSIVLENGFARPTTEGSADSTNYVVASTTPTLTVTDTSLHIYTFVPVVTPFGRLKITGNSGNDSGNTITTLKLYIPKQ